MRVRITTHGLYLLTILLTFSVAAAGQKANTTVSQPAGQDTNLHWMDAYVSTRFIYVDNRGGRTRMNDLQYKFQLKGQWRFDRCGATYLQFRAETGSAFQPGWNYSGWGRNRANESFSLKDFFLGQRIGSRLELRAGGIEFDRGVGSEATFADDDGFQVGYQLRYALSRGRWLDRLQITVSHIGEFHHPNVFARIPGMADPNSLQVLGEKRLTDKLEVSGGFSRIQGVEFARGALRWTPSRFVERVTLESIVRTADNPSLGYSLQLGRKFGGRRPCNLTLTYSHMESGVFANKGARLLLNGDQPNLGQRVAVNFSRPLGRGFSATSYVSRQLEDRKSVV